MEFEINHEPQWEFQLGISDVLSHHNQRRPRDLDFKYSLLTLLVKGVYYFAKILINITDCVRMTGYWFETVFKMHI